MAFTLDMPEFDRIDLMNFAMYGNDFDPQWEEIRAYLKSSSHAQKELEEIKRTLPAPSLGGKRRREVSLAPNPDSVQPRADQESLSSSQKTWWQKLLGE